MKDVAESGLLLGLAWFAAVNVGTAIASWVVARVILRRTSERGAVALGLRLLPATASLLMLMLFVPSHWRLEPSETIEANESFGFVVYAAAAIALAILWRSSRRAWDVGRAAWRLRACDRLPRVHDDASIRVVRELNGVSLVGIWRTRILVGDRVMRELTAAELDVAMAHEAAHRLSGDNLKRSVLYCAPDCFWMFGAASQLEARWHAAAECAADARAVAGNPARALDLASALVKVSRLSAKSPAWAASPAWSSLHDPALLDMRVRRLVGGRVRQPGRPLRIVPGLAIATVALGLLASNPQVASFLHQLTEALIARLP